MIDHRAQDGWEFAGKPRRGATRQTSRPSSIPSRSGTTAPRARGKRVESDVASVPVPPGIPHPSSHLVPCNLAVQVVKTWPRSRRSGYTGQVLLQILDILLPWIDRSVPIFFLTEDETCSSNLPSQQVFVVDLL